MITNGEPACAAFGGEMDPAACDSGETVTTAPVGGRDAMVIDNSHVVAGVAPPAGTSAVVYGAAPPSPTTTAVMGTSAGDAPDTGDENVTVSATTLDVVEPPFGCDAEGANETVTGS